MFISLTNTDFWIVINSCNKKRASVFHKYTNGNMAIRNNYNALIACSPHLQFDLDEAIQIGSIRTIDIAIQQFCEKKIVCKKWKTPSMVSIKRRISSNQPVLTKHLYNNTIVTQAITTNSRHIVFGKRLLWL